MVLDLYKTQFAALHQLVRSYVSLLETDIGLINETGAELVRTDSHLGQYLDSGLD